MITARRVASAAASVCPSPIAYYVGDYHAHRLRPPPRGYRWVRRDSDFLLVAATTGLIASVIAASR